VKILALISVLFFSCNSAFAHSCVTYSRSSDKEHNRELQKIDAIFCGEVISIGEPLKNKDESKYGSQILKIKVLRVWKGIETNEVSIAYTRAYTTFEKEIGDIGTTKLFYAYRLEDDSKLHIDSCSFTLFDDEKMKREYGDGKVFEQSQIEQNIREEQTENAESFWNELWKSITSFFS
jgi:hypothetical protein